MGADVNGVRYAAMDVGGFDAKAYRDAVAARVERRGGGSATTSNRGQPDGSAARDLAAILAFRRQMERDDRRAGRQEADPFVIRAGESDDDEDGNGDDLWDRLEDAGLVGQDFCRE